MGSVGNPPKSLPEEARRLRSAIFSLCSHHLPAFPPEMSGTIETASNHDDEGSINSNEDSTASSSEEYSGNEFDSSFSDEDLPDYIHSIYLLKKWVGLAHNLVN